MRGWFEIKLTKPPGINTYVYAFLNLETRSAYAEMFKRIFNVLTNVGRKTIAFRHISGGDDGLQTVTMDMCKKQAGGK